MAHLTFDSRARHSANQLYGRSSLQRGEKLSTPTIDQQVLVVSTATDIKKEPPTYCRLFTFPLSYDVIMIHLAALFWSIGMPHAFQVLTRSLQAMYICIISGLCQWHVDVLIVVSPIVSYQRDSDIVDVYGQQFQC